MTPYRVHGIIAIEEQPTTDGRLVRREALTWETPVPVFNIAGAGRPATVIGHLDEIERVGNYVLARGEVDDPRPVMPCGIDITEGDVPPEDTDRLFVINSGEIRAVTVYLEVDELPAWPGVALLRIPEED